MVGLLNSQLLNWLRLSIYPNFFFSNKYMGIPWPVDSCWASSCLRTNCSSAYDFSLVKAVLPPPLNLETQSLWCPGFGQSAESEVVLGALFKYFLVKHFLLYSLFYGLSLILRDYYSEFLTAVINLLPINSWLSATKGLTFPFWPSVPTHSTYYTLCNS